jgi:hypothetical protein
VSTGVAESPLFAVDANSAYLSKSVSSDRRSNLKDRKKIKIIEKKL